MVLMDTVPNGTRWHYSKHRGACQASTDETKQFDKLFIIG
jgi:hypothetical protein